MVVVDLCVVFHVIQIGRTAGWIDASINVERHAVARFDHEPNATFAAR